MKASVNVPLEVNLTTDILLNNEEYANFIYKESTKRIDKVVQTYFENAFCNNTGFLENKAEREMRYTVNQTIEKTISREIKSLLNEQKEEILDAVVKDIADRIERSSKTKTEMAELLLTVLTLK